MSETPPLTPPLEGAGSGSGMTFWDHLDELRSVIIRILVITVVAAVVAFFLKDELFAIVLAPRSSDFITFRLMGVEPFSVHLMNTDPSEDGDVRRSIGGSALHHLPAVSLCLTGAL